MAHDARSAKVRRWRRILQRFHKSGLTGAEFCRRHGLSDQAFYYWKRRLQQMGLHGREEAPATVGGIEFVPVHVRHHAPVVVEFPSGVRLTIPPGEYQALQAAIGTLASMGQGGHGY